MMKVDGRAKCVCIPRPPVLQLRTCSLLTFLAHALFFIPSNFQSTEAEMRSLWLLARRFSHSYPSLTHSYTHGASDTPLMHKTIATALRERVEAHPEREVFVFPEQGIRKTYAEFYEEARGLASSLVALGVKPGDRVGLWAPNVYEWTLTQFATAIAGFVMVPRLCSPGSTLAFTIPSFQANINPAYQAHELEYCLKKIGVRTLLSASHFKSQDFYKLICEAAPELPGQDAAAMYHKHLPELRDVVMFGGAAEEEKTRPGTIPWSELIEARTSFSDAKLDNFAAAVCPDHPYNVQFTSGTTGHPKGVVLFAKQRPQQRPLHRTPIRRP